MPPCRMTCSFQPTLPVRGATSALPHHPEISLFQPTLPVRGATRPAREAGGTWRISTHAPRAGSDSCRGRDFILLFISTHAPRAGSDGYIMTSQIYPHIFQPTLPVRGATRIIPKCKRATINFNPRSPCGERQARTCTVRCSSWISTHAPRTGSDRVGDMVTGRVSQFQPTLPVRGATYIAYWFLV